VKSLKWNTIHKGDCLALLDKIEPSSIDMVFADPPYNLSGKTLNLKGNKTGGDWFKVNEKWDVYTDSEYQEFSNQWIQKAVKALSDSGSIYVCCSQHNIDAVMQSLRLSNCRINNILVWQKSNPMPNTTKRLYTHSVEFIIWAVKGKGWIFNAFELRDMNPDTQKDGSPRMMRDVWTFPVVQGEERLRGDDGRALHPTQKPLELVKRTIAASSNVGQVVLDPFMGSGTTAVAAKLLGRSWLGIERDDVYIEAARERIAKTRVAKKPSKRGKNDVK
jgi:site-specific DNA-methyltransferase (adenine-specific)/modification methylase